MLMKEFSQASEVSKYTPPWANLGYIWGLYSFFNFLIPGGSNQHKDEKPT